METVIAVGDIHGQLVQLATLLDYIEPRFCQPNCNLVLLGDYIDRGPGSCNVIDRLIKWQEKHGNAVFLRGNHEQLLVVALNGPPCIITPTRKVIPSYPMDMWLINGGYATLESYGQITFLPPWDAVPQFHLTFIESTELEFRTDTHIFVHAGLLPTDEWWEGDPQNFDPRLWIRSPFINSEEDFGGIVVFGHTPQMCGKPLIQNNKIGIDTVAVFGNALTAFVIKNGLERFIQVHQNLKIIETQLSACQ